MLLMFVADTPTKKLHLSAEKPKRKIKFKDLDELVNEPTIPVSIGSRVFCQGFEDKGPFHCFFISSQQSIN
jgi:hypothetical protein